MDKVPFTAAGQSFKFCVTASGGPLKVTLVWHDPPASLSAVTQLVNDLDLTVYANSLNGYSRLGNGVSDRLNNVEQVREHALLLERGVELQRSSADV